MIVLADAAHDDGVTWESRESIAAKALLSKGHVTEVLKELDDEGEVARRTAQRGRRRINVYRVLVGTVAAATVDYDDLPFELSSPFDEVRNPDVVDAGRGQNDRVDEVRSAGSSPYIDPTPNRRDAAHPWDAPPRLTRPEGQDVALNALADVCNVDLNGGRASELTTALHGTKKRKQSVVPIRSQFWREYVASEPDVEPDDDDIERFEEALARMIRSRADTYSEVMDDAVLTPTALAKWWTDLPKLRKARGRGLTAEDILAIPDDEL